VKVARYFPPDARTHEALARDHASGGPRGSPDACFTPITSVPLI
jgi:hypothetical protein